MDEKRLKEQAVILKILRQLAEDQLITIEEEMKVKGLLRQGEC